MAKSKAKAKSKSKPISSTSKRANQQALYAKNQEHLAWLADVDERTIRKWRDDGMPLKRSAQGIAVRPILLWLRGKETTASNEVRDAMADARLRREIAQAEIAERENKKQAGLYVTVEEAQRQRLTLLRWMVGVMDRAGSELASKLAGKVPASVRRIVREYFDQIREGATRNGH